MMNVHRTVATTIRRFFPDTLVLPSIGNNDTMHHYSDVNPKMVPEERTYY